MIGNTLPLSLENDLILKQVRERNEWYLKDLSRFKPIFLKPCRVRILMVTDGGLDFGTSGFGLSTLLSILHTPPGPYVRFEITVAHRSNVSDAQVALNRPEVHRSIKQFRFDNPQHFTPEAYDELWLFGFATSTFTGRTWINKPTEDELRAIGEFMDRGGGVFATGDHGGLGSALCGHIPRVRTMRRWFEATGPFNNPAAPDMNGSQRNDTNRRGHDLDSDFDDQSDDIPQEIQPKFYSRPLYGLWRYRWPHPLLCGPNGVIRVLPDHPHEGECVTPYEINRTFALSGYSMVEYPNAITGGGQVIPEVIARSTVLSGSTAGNTKSSTVAQDFGAICAYDGQLADVGRVVTDATWHHFVNINLVGRPGFGGDPEPAKTLGFLASPTGQAHFENIKAYYRNIAVWLAPKAKLECMRRGGIWILLWEHRLLEAVTSGHIKSLAKLDLDTIYIIGRHARDVLGKFAGQCQSQIWILDLVRPLVPLEIWERLYPWPPPLKRKKVRPSPGPDPVPWFDPEPLVDIALGGAVVALREAFPEPEAGELEKVEAVATELMMKGATLALVKADASLQISGQRLNEFRQVAKPALAEAKKRS